MKFIVTHLLVSFFIVSIYSQSSNYIADDFETLIEVKTTSVKNQFSTGTCWSFATLSMLESEILTLTGNTYNFSEMWVVRHAYIDKAIKYVRMHGSINFSGGGATNDVTNVWRKYGIVPEGIYEGKRNKDGSINHAEMDAKLKKYVAGVVKSEDMVTENWIDGYLSILDEYLGEIPTEFKYKGEKYTPLSFAASLPINPNDYILLGSYTHHPFYESFIIEIPDNWSWGQLYNLPLEEFKQVVDSSLFKGHSISWAADVSESGFDWKNGLAVVLPGANSFKESETQTGALSLNDVLNMPVGSTTDISAVVEVNQEIRQEQFDSYLTTDDHGMQIAGICLADDGQEFYKVKNSWGDDNKFKGFLYVSDQYLTLKSTSVMINKNALPESIKEKLNL